MGKVVGIQFREAGKIYHFHPGDLELKKGEFVLVHTDHGPGVGRVGEGPFYKESDSCEEEHKPVERLANEDEVQKYYRNVEREQEAKEYCLERIGAHQLPMNLVDVEYFFDGSKVVFYFTADGRVDFRELLKDLVRKLRMRVELRQIGVRHKAKMVGGLGGCGLPLCCATFLRNFQPVSIKMAKDQNLSLNPTKISGACGRLMCCLQYEHGTYKELKKDMPKLGKKIDTSEGRGKVVRQNILEGLYTIHLEDGREVEKQVERRSDKHGRGQCQKHCGAHANRNGEAKSCRGEQPKAGPEGGQKPERNGEKNPGKQSAPKAEKQEHKSEKQEKRKPNKHKNKHKG